jgi:taurine dioxygenase
MAGIELEVTPSGGACGAAIRGVDLSRPLDADVVTAIREAWLKHFVLAFPNQRMSAEDLERFTLAFGPFGDDPFIGPIDGHQNIIAVERRANETGPLFAEGWHTDWSFQEVPPAGTCLYSITIPPHGGDTLFVNQHLAYERMPADLKKRLEGLKAIHSARGAYAKNGVFGEHDVATRSMDIHPSDDALDEQIHPLIRTHPETKCNAIFGCVGYIIGFEGMTTEKSLPLLSELYTWQTREEFQYRHKWRENMLLMWDNRSVLHMATGGYDGFDRLLHRTTIGGP